jgi:HAD superfamily hydrolase (TIGR01509 family)
VLARIRTVLFDLDGTLTVPIIDFDAIRKKLELPPGTPLVHALTGLPPERYEAGMRVIHEAELEAAHNATANRGVHELLDALAARAIKTAIVTRNSGEAPLITLDRIGIAVDFVVTREFGPMKPSPKPLLAALSKLEGHASEALMVGDFRDDMEAGRAAGTATCLVMNGPGPPKFDADLHVPWPEDLLSQFRQAWK